MRAPVLARQAVAEFLGSAGLVTVVAADARDLPPFPGKRYGCWPVEDPAGRDPDAVRRIVDDIDVRVRTLLGGLAVLPDDLPTRNTPGEQRQRGDARDQR
jgi:hypothetical protein